MKKLLTEIAEWTVMIAVIGLIVFLLIYKG